ARQEVVAIIGGKKHTAAAGVDSSAGDGDALLKDIAPSADSVDMPGAGIGHLAGQYELPAIRRRQRGGVVGLVGGKINAAAGHVRRDDAAVVERARAAEEDLGADGAVLAVDQDVGTNRQRRAAFDGNAVARAGAAQRDGAGAAQCLISLEGEATV